MMQATECAKPLWTEACGVSRERMLAAATDEFLAATDVADLLVRRGLPFREAHAVVAGLVVVGWRRYRRAMSELEHDRRALRAEAESIRELLQSKHLNN